MAEREAVNVWTRPERGTRGPAPEYSRARLTAAAVELADGHGLAAVSMRKVAEALGTGPASLYRYLACRDDLVDLMADAVTGDIDLRVALTGDPVEDLVALALRTKSVHLRHPWLADVPPERLRIGPNGLDYLEYALRAMAPVALPGRAKTEAVALMSAVVTLFARNELHDRHTSDNRRQAQAAYLLEAAARGRHPYLTAALQEPHGTTADATSVADTQDQFAGLMRRVLHGLLTPELSPGA